MQDYDLIIIGAGPAGSTLATLVAQSGYKVLILEKHAFPRYKVGESLLPATVRDLADLLGLDRKVFQEHFVSKRGATFSWGAEPDSMWNLNFGGPRSAEPILQPEVPSAFNVDRSQFDQILLDNAIKHGVTVMFNCTAQNYIEIDGVVTGISYIDEQWQVISLTARFVADASGQNSKLARAMGKRTFSSFFKKMAVWGYYDNAARIAKPFEGNVFLEANKGSWIWHIPISDKVTSVGIVAPAGDFTRDLDADAYLESKTSASPRIRNLLQGSTRSSRPPYNETRVCSDYSYCYASFFKPGALVLGDAACFVDVLLSSGVHLATYAAVLAAQSIKSVLKGELSERVAMTEYEVRLRKEYAIFYDGLVGLYDMSKGEDDYIQWLRTLLIDTSGIAFEPESLAVTHVTPDNELRLFAQSQKNLAAMREHNLQQLSYDGHARMFTNKLPDLGYTLVPSDDMRSWLRVI